VSVEYIAGTANRPVLSLEAAQFFPFEFELEVLDERLPPNNLADISLILSLILSSSVGSC
jgi:hypothetical protein